MINRCTFIGNVGNDPEIRKITGATVANFSIACSESWTDKDGVKQTKTEWIRCVAWRGLGEVVERYVTKGQQLYVEGKLENGSYEKDGVTHYTTTINVQTLKMLGRKSDDSGQQQSTGARPNPAMPQNNGFMSQEPEPVESDDLPF